MNDMDIALRSYVKEKNPKEAYYQTRQHYEVYERVLVFDTETTIDEYQNLTFGFFQIYERGILQGEGLFYSPDLSEKDFGILKKYSEEKSITLLDVRQFVDEIFLKETYDYHTLCIGFNLPFDLSRISIHFSNARKHNRGGFSFQLSENTMYPRLTIKHISNTLSFIRFTNAPNKERGNMRHRKNSNTYRGRFLDLRTLSFALSNRKYSLDRACKDYSCDIQKGTVEEHGKISPDYIGYNIQDVKATYSLYLKLKEGYSKYSLDLPIHQVYSPASLGKAYLKSMGVKSFLEKNPDFPPEILGYIMTTYYGGRSEVKIRKKPVQVAYMDVLSMYPTVNILQDLWKFVICDSIDYTEDTERVKEFLESIDLDRLQNKETWKDFHVICLVEPDGEIFPIRGHYAEKNTFNIGVNHLTSETPIWYSLTDVISAKLLSGRTPKIKKAIRFIPNGIQYGLNEIDIIGGKRFDPTKGNLFKTIIEERKRIQQLMNETDDEEEKRKLDGQQNILKIITNASSYGMFVEIRTEHKPETELEIFGLERFETKRDKIEENGIMFNPIMGAFITSGARLILAIAEKILMDHGEVYAFCDTDSMAVPPGRVNDIRNYFNELNPYDLDLEVFEMEKENFKPKDWNDLKKGVNKETQLPLWFYGISAKRYVLYNLIDGKPVIRKYSAHGLGHLLNPFREDETDKRWHEVIWQDILDIEYGLNTLENVIEKYRRKYAMSKLGITSPEIIKRFKILNTGTELNGKIKPYNFVIIGTSSEPRKHTLEAIKPMIPFTKDYQMAPYRDFVDYHTGDSLNGVQYWKTMDEAFMSYLYHPEAKFTGNIGILNRRHLIVSNIIHIGKESNKLEVSNVLGVDRNGYAIYDKGLDLVEKYGKEFILSIGPKMAKDIGLTRGKLYGIKAIIKSSK